MHGHAYLEWLVVVFILVVFWLGPGQAMVRGEWRGLAFAVVATALVFLIGALMQRWFARRAERLAAAEGEKNDPLPQVVGLIFVFCFSYVLSTIAPFAVLSGIAGLTDWRPPAAGLSFWLAIFGLLFWRLRHLPETEPGERWRLPAGITAAAMIVSGLAGLILREVIGELWAIALATPMATLLAVGFLVLALHLPADILAESPLAASRLWLSRSVFAAGILTAALGVSATLDKDVPGWLPVIPLMLFFCTLGYALWRLPGRERQA